MVFRYHIEPIGGALAVAGVFAVIGLLFGQSPLNIVPFITAGGPLLWVLIQLRRRGMTIEAGEDHLLVRRSVSGRQVKVAYRDVRGCVATKRGGLALAFREEPPAAKASDGITDRTPGEAGNRPLALVDARPEAPRTPRQRFLLTARVVEVARLVEWIDQRRAALAPAEGQIPPEYMRRLVARRRLRDFIVALIAVLCTPLYTILLVRIVISF